MPVFEIYEPVYLITVAVFILGLHRMGTPATAKSGILWAGIAMAFAVAATFTLPGLNNIPLILVGIAVGSAAGFYSSARVAMVNMPQMVAIFNGMGAGAASSIASVELVRGTLPPYLDTVGIIGAAIGNISIAGSMIAFLKLQGWITQKPLTFRLQNLANTAVLIVAAVAGTFFVIHPAYIGGASFLLILFSVLTVLYGIVMALPVGGADMPVIIAFFNALTGIAVALDGYTQSNYAMVVAGIFVGAAGSILTGAMASAMNRTLPGVLFGGASLKAGTMAAGGEMRPVTPEDAAILMGYATRVIIVPGFGLAAAQAQFRARELYDVLVSRGISVDFAIHPVAGRMPGHMNVLLAEANVPYDAMLDLDEANGLLPSTDVALVVGANDVVNPSAREEGNTLSGMPILDVDSAENIIVIKRGKGSGYAGVENSLFTNPKTGMLFGDAQEALGKLVHELRKLS